MNLELIGNIFRGCKNWQITLANSNPSSVHSTIQSDYPSKHFFQLNSSHRLHFLFLLSFAGIYKRFGTSRELLLIFSWTSIKIFKLGAIWISLGQWFFWAKLKCSCCILQNWFFKGLGQCWESQEVVILREEQRVILLDSIGGERRQVKDLLGR